MRVSTIFNLDRMDFDAIFQQINLNYRQSYTQFQNLVAETLLPESFMCLFDPQRIFGNPLRTFWQSFVSHSLQNRDFCCYVEMSVPIMRGPLGCLLGFCLSGSKPCEGNHRPGVTGCVSGVFFLSA